MIKTRYMYLNEEILKENPNMCAYMAPSLDARQDMVVVEVPKLGKEAAVKAIKEWGHWYHLDHEKCQQSTERYPAMRVIRTKDNCKL